MNPLIAFEPMELFSYVLYGLGAVMALALGPILSGMRYIPHNRVGIVEKLWSPAGSLTEGHMIVVDDESRSLCFCRRDGEMVSLFVI